MTRFAPGEVVGGLHVQVRRATSLHHLQSAHLHGDLRPIPHVLQHKVRRADSASYQQVLRPSASSPSEVLLHERRNQSVISHIAAAVIRCLILSSLVTYL